MLSGWISGVTFGSVPYFLLLNSIFYMDKKLCVVRIESHCIDPFSNFGIRELIYCGNDIEGSIDVPIYIYI